MKNKKIKNSCGKKGCRVIVLPLMIPKEIPLADNPFTEEKKAA
jgi:hypothetical protein